MKVNILLSTYNGEKFLPEFLNSLEKQTFKDWILFVRDDGSVDKTLEILKAFQNTNSTRCIILQDNKGNLGACKSFLNLLREVDGDYFMFADQDDIWLPEKIKKTLNKMLEVEKMYQKNRPILIHTDLTVVDYELKIISKSLWKYQGIDPRKKSLNYLLVQNNITGCTIMINKALKILIKTIPTQAIMHDWWLALVASAFGVIEYIAEPTILYRKHEQQSIGISKYSFKFYIKKLLNFNKNKELAIDAIIKSINQANEFLIIYNNLLSKEKKEKILNYLSLFKINKINRLLNIIKCKFYRHGLIRNLMFISLLTTLDEQEIKIFKFQ